MIVAVCIDDKGGMLFNNRRQSRDRVLIEDLLALSGEKKIYISHFSKELFSEYGERVTEDENFLETAGKEDICFVENIDLSAYSDRIDKIILYHWNRHYPSSMKLTLDISEYRMTESVEFQGSSHEKITREEYIR